jgi:Acyl-CoA oxidase
MSRCSTSLKSYISFDYTGAIEGLLCKRVRTDCLSLIEAWQFSDQRLDSTLGRSDGKVSRLQGSAVPLLSSLLWSEVHCRVVLCCVVLCCDVWCEVVFQASLG